MFFKESNSFLTNKNKKFIEEIVLGNTFPFYFNNNINKKEKGHFLTHIFMIFLHNFCNLSLFLVIIFKVFLNLPLIGLNSNDSV
jgi:hypothetical protein